MADEEKNESTGQEELQAEGSEVDAAGPVAEDGPPAEAPEDAPSTPPAEEAQDTSEGPSASDSSGPSEGEPAPEQGDSGTPGSEAEDVPGPDAEDEPEVEQDEADPGKPGSEAEDVPGDDEGLPWKERRRLERSRRSHDAQPQRSPEDRASERRQDRRAKAVARSRYRQAQRSKGGAPGTGTPAADRRPNPPKVRQGVVVSDKADKTITVRIDIARRHPTYEKIVRRSRSLHAHDERNEAGEGDTVRVVETRPLSRLKRWRLLEVIERAK